MARRPCRSPASQICHSLKRGVALCQASQGPHLHEAAAMRSSLGHCLHTVTASDVCKGGLHKGEMWAEAQKLQASQLSWTLHRCHEKLLGMSRTKFLIEGWDGLMT